VERSTSIDKRKIIIYMDDYVVMPMKMVSLGSWILGLDVGHIDHMLATCAAATQSTRL
jgi:hypothetical protein